MYPFNPKGTVHIMRCRRNSIRKWLEVHICEQIHFKLGTLAFSAELCFPIALSNLVEHRSHMRTEVLAVKAGRRKGEGN